MPICTTQGSAASLSRRPAKYRAQKTKGLEPHPKGRGCRATARRPQPQPGNQLETWPYIPYYTRKRGAGARANVWFAPPTKKMRAACCARSGPAPRLRSASALAPQNPFKPRQTMEEERKEGGMGVYEKALSILMWTLEYSQGPLQLNVQNLSPHRAARSRPRGQGR